MNRVQFWLLLLLGCILCGTAAFWLFGYRPTPQLTSAAGAPAIDAPVQITEIARRRPNMLLVGGTAPANATLTLRLSGNKIGATTADARGAFQLTTSPLPKGETLDLALDYGAGEPIRLLVIDRGTQLVALLKGRHGLLPMQRPANGSGVLLVEQTDDKTLHLVGQAAPDATIYAYVNGTLAGKAMTAPDARAPALFNLQLTGTPAVLGNIQLDIYNGSTIAARTALELLDDKKWQAVSLNKGKAPVYLWRDLDAQQQDTDETFPGHFIPIVQPDVR